MDFSNHYDQYTFAYFKKPADEPVLALSMAVAGLKPCPHQDRIIFLPSYEGKIFTTGKGTMRIKGLTRQPVIMHFGNRNLPRFVYQYQLALIQHRQDGGEGPLPRFKRLKIRFRSLPLDTKVFLKRMVKVILPERILEWNRVRKNGNK